MNPSRRTPLRVLAYSHDSFGLGHLRRSMSVVSAMVRRDGRVHALCVTGSPMPDLFDMPPRCDVVKLPCITKDADGEYQSRTLPVPFDEVVRLRSDLILASIRAFRPDLVLVDHAAHGAGGELVPVLRKLRHEAIRTRVVLGMRDVLDAPHRVRAQMASQRTHDVLRNAYDELLVYGDPRVLDVGDAYDLPADLRAKISYVGIACQRDAVPAPAPRRESATPQILATAGGGADGYSVLRGLIAALRGPLRTADLRATIVAGPLMAADDLGALKLAALNDARIEVLVATREMNKLLDRADLVVGMGGYNSVYEAISRGRRLLVWPRSQPRLEQLERCRRLAALGLLAMLRDEDLVDPESFAQHLREALARGTPDVAASGLSFDGAERAAERLLDGVDSARHASFRIAAAP